jgi:hypothetical protein
VCDHLEISILDKITTLRQAVNLFKVRTFQVFGNNPKKTKIPFTKKLRAV